MFQSFTKIYIIMIKENKTDGLMKKADKVGKVA